jgi:hypothetical protein
MAFSAFDFTDFDKRFSLFLRCRSPFISFSLCASDRRFSLFLRRDCPPLNARLMIAAALRVR